MVRVFGLILSGHLLNAVIIICRQNKSLANIVKKKTSLHMYTNYIHHVTDHPFTIYIFIVRAREEMLFSSSLHLLF